MFKSDASSLSALGRDELGELVLALLGRVSVLEAENAALREEIARLKGLNGRPKIKPSGMEAKVGSSGRSGKGRSKGKRRSAGPRSGRSRPELVANEERKLEMAVPPGSRFKGYEDFVVQDLRLASRVVRYRRERWQLPDGRPVVAPLPAGL